MLRSYSSIGLLDVESKIRFCSDLKGHSIDTNLMDMVNLQAYALSFLGLPYIWGGSSPLNGFDCSGLVQEILMAAGVDPKGDQTAQGLFDYFSNNGNFSRYGLGSLAFYGKSAKAITHIGFCLDSLLMIEAGGGDSTCIDVKSSQAKGASIRMRPIKYRTDLVAVIKPHYPNQLG